MPTPISDRDVSYICEHMLHIKWRPQLNMPALEILSKTDSKLEQMFFLGAWHFIEQQGKLSGGSDSISVTTSKVEVRGRQYTGLWLLAPWHGWYKSTGPWGGPSALAFVPQFESPEKAITHDFGLFYGNDNGRPEWRLRAAVEVDGYGVHKERRDLDGLRDTGLSYPVMRFREETDKPLDWFRTVVEADDAERGF